MEFEYECMCEYNYELYQWKMYQCLYYFCQEIFHNLCYVIWGLVEYELCMNEN